MRGRTFSFISYKIKVLLFVYFHVNFNYTHFILIKKKYKHFILKLAKKKKVFNLVNVFYTVLIYADVQYIT